MRSGSALVVVYSLISLVAQNDVVHRRHKYKHSFKGPHLIAGNGRVPFWDVYGHAIASDESIRLVPSLKSKIGSAWNRIPAAFANFEVEMVFRINGRGRLGADGMALWFTEQVGTSGPVYGAADRWRGMAVLFDSYDNDHKQNNPYVSLILNDGTKEYDHHQDGSTQETAGCQKDFRNKPMAIRIKLTYLDNMLTLLINNGLANDELAYETCFRVSNVVLPSNGHFGISAATGGLADDHDVVSFNTFELVRESDVAKDTLAAEERRKHAEVFKKHDDEFREEKKKYREQNPDMANDVDEDEVEETNQRDLRNIYEANGKILHHIGSIKQRTDEMYSRQDGILNELGRIGQRLHGQPPPPQQPPSHHQQQGMPPGGMPPSQAPPEIAQLLTMSRDMMNEMVAMRQMLQQQIAGGGGGSQGEEYLKRMITEKLTQMEQLMSRIAQQQQEVPRAAPSSQVQISDANCVSTFTLLFVILVQSIGFIGYSVYSSMAERKAKKFY